MSFLLRICILPGAGSSTRQGRQGGGARPPGRSEDLDLVRVRARPDRVRFASSQTLSPTCHFSCVYAYCPEQEAVQRRREADSRSTLPASPPTFSVPSGPPRPPRRRRSPSRPKRRPRPRSRPRDETTCILTYGENLRSANLNHVLLERLGAQEVVLGLADKTLAMARPTFSRSTTGPHPRRATSRPSPPSRSPKASGVIVFTAARRRQSPLRAP
jgi:hypothetical protein